jgi:transcriptional regulator with XRE-family HTH domain/quercetin dioxygenase-like cupin family protein
VPRTADPPVGERIREERTRRGVSLRGLARDVGVSPSLISQIETGKCQPSVGTLYAITTALGISIEDVFAPASVSADELAAAPVPGHGTISGASGGSSASAAPPHTASPPAAALALLTAERGASPVARAGEREVLHLDSGVTWERLGHVPGVQANFLLATYAPGGSSSGTGELMRHTGAEFGYVIEGELILTLDGDEQHLTAGHSVSFTSSTPHSYRNDAPRPAVGIWFVTG